MKLILPKQLRKQGVLGMNSRNIDYISRHNQRHLYRLVDNKLNTKQAAQQAGITVPKLLGVIENQWQLKNLEDTLKDWDKFVIKPSRGSGGKGIMVVTGRDQSDYLKPSGQKLRLLDIHRNTNNILSGLYSLGGKADVAMIEELIEFDDFLNDYTYEGVPDLRVVVFKGFPVMAMLRCSTHASDGRANLHQGAIGVGIDLFTGNSLFAVQHNKPVSHHPDTEHSFAKLTIPGWQNILELAASCYEMTGLGYLGCDIVLDKQKGPVILELNARPGLAIQIANGLGLSIRLNQVETLEIADTELSAAERIKALPKIFGQP